MLGGLLVLALSLQDTKPDCHARTAAWATNSDYPAEARRKAMQGDVEFELQVSEKGCGISCAVTKSSGWPLLDEETCRLMVERARFNPARDKDGKPIPATWKSAFHWQLP